MPKKDRKAAYLDSMKAEEQAVRSRFERAETALARDTQKRRPTAPPAGKAKEIAGPAPKVESVTITRDSFSMPADEYEIISRVRKRGFKREIILTKSEVVRAGLAAIDRMSDKELFGILEGLARVKTGRPAGG